MPPPSEPEFDLVIRGGTVVTADSRAIVDVGIQGESVVQVGGAMRGRREIDARDRLVLPGGIDPHVHLTCSDATETEPGWVDDFHSGSEAALAGGITTLGNMSFVLPSETMGHRMDVEGELVRQQSIADVMLHPALLSPMGAAVEEVSGLPERGVTSLKFFMSFPTFEAFAGQFLLAMRAAGQAGSITMIHCEDLATIECCSTLIGRKAHQHLTDFAETRPVLAELTATQRAIAMCELTGAPTYIVHLSSARALQSCAEARARGLPLFVETRPLYLHLTRECYERDDGALFVAQPPLRDDADREALWKGLADGTIDTMGSDHAPWTQAMKMSQPLDLWNMRPGVADLETMLPLLLTDGVLAGRLTLERFVAVTATNAARLFGLYPRKGTIAPGSDADVVIWDMHEPRPLRGSQMHSRAGHTVYEGHATRASVHTTIRRGEIVFENGQVVGRPGSGVVLARGKTQPLPNR